MKGECLQRLNYRRLGINKLGVNWTFHDVQFPMKLDFYCSLKGLATVSYEGIKLVSLCQTFSRLLVPSFSLFMFLCCVLFMAAAPLLFTSQCYI